jgi:outer membrane protein
MRRFVGICVAIVAVLGVSSAATAATLPEYMAAALKNNPQRRISHADVLDAEASQTEALSVLLPTISASASYQKNQYESKFPLVIPPATVPVNLTIAPFEQREANLNVRIPLIDGPAIARWKAARISTKAVRSDDAVSEQELLLTVSRTYYVALASQELVRAAERSKTASERNAQIASTRVAAGTSTALFADRAEYEVTRNEQTLVDARRAWLVAARSLATLTGLPEPASIAVPLPNDEPAPPEEQLVSQAISRRPELTSFSDRLHVAQLAKRASWLQYAPTFYATGRDRWTNAPGFGRSTSYVVGLSADWLLVDFGGRIGEAKKAKAAVLRADAALENERNAVRDEVHTAWLDLEGARVKVVSARRGAEVAAKASEEVDTRFGAGTATQLDVIQADRDRLQADVERIRAEADLAVARISLRRASGENIAP